MYTADTIMKSYLTIGYDAVAVSSNDLTAGEQFFEKSAGFKFPWISANIFDTSGNLLFKPSTLKEIGGITIGIIGLTGKGNYSNEQIVIGDWQKPLAVELQYLAPKSDMVILLSNLPFSENDKITQSFPEVDLIITADKRRGNLAPQLSGNALITQSQSRGKYLGRLFIKYGQSGKWSYDSSNTLKILDNRIKSVERQIVQLEKKKSHSTQSNFTAKFDKLTSIKRDLEKKQEMETANLKQRESTNKGMNTFKSDFIPIRPRSQESQEIKLMIAELKNRINKYNRRSLEQKKQPSSGGSTKEKGRHL